MVRIDGSQGEGGGQILRSSLSLAAITGQELEIYNVRAGRKKPGLAAQHVTCCVAVAQVCGGRVHGAELGSQTVSLSPGTTTGGEYEFDVAQVRPSAGSACLVLQSVLPVLALAPQSSHVVIKGGTDVPWSPVYAYLANTFALALSGFGVELALRRPGAGFYPVGKGRIEAKIAPASTLSPIGFTQRGELRRAVVASTVADELPEHILKRQNYAAVKLLAAEGLEVNTEEYYLCSESPGTSCVVSLSYESGHAGFTALGKRGMPAEKVGSQAGSEALEFMRSEATVDRRLADQLLLYMVMARGRSEFRTTQVTEHLRTNAAVARQLTGAEINIEEDGWVTVQGVGLATPQTE